MTEYRFAEGTANEYVLDESEIVSHNPILSHTGKSDAIVTCQEVDQLKTLAQDKTRVTYYESGSAEWTGYLLNASVNERTGDMQLDLDGIALRLEETHPDYESLGGNIVYTNTALDTAIRDYWSRTPFDATVYDQATELIEEGTDLASADTQAEWQDFIGTTIAATDPFEINATGPTTLQTAFTAEAEDQDTNKGPSADANYSGGEGIVLLSGGDYVEQTFTLDYTLPAENFAPYIRAEFFDTANEIEVTLDGNSLGTFNIAVGGGALQWANVKSGGVVAPGDDLDPGSHTLRFEVVSGGNDATILDVVAPLDDRFTYTFDNSVSGSGYLDGPQHYPQEFTVTSQSYLTSYNITAADLTTTFSNTDGQQRISVSNDGGANYDRASNTNSLSAAFASTGREAVVELRFGRGGSRTTATPQTGYLNQEVDTVDLDVDLNDRTVISRLELSRSHFRNLKSLHEYGNFVWVIDPGGGDLDTLGVESFSKGSQTKATPDALTEPENITSEVKAEGYYNKIRLEGALQDDGTRPTAEVEDSDAIDRDRGAISPGVLRDLSITTDAGATFRANALLQIALDNNNRTGRIDAPAGLVLPGYSYSVDLGEGVQEKTLEEADLNASSGEYSGTYRFVPPATISETISELRRNATSFENQV